MKRKSLYSLTFIVIACCLILNLCSCSRNRADGNNSSDKEISVFYYTFSDTYISSVRSALGKALSAAGIKFNDYDANGSQTTQTEQIQTALAKGSGALVVNIVDTGSDDAARTIVELARGKDIPVIFFNRSVAEEIVTSYEKCAFVGTDYEMAGHMQGEMVGSFLVENYDAVDLNDDGKINYVMFKGQEGNMEAIARTRYGVEDCNRVLTENGYPELSFYDPSNTNNYLVDQDGLWSSASATNYMGTILAGHSEAGGNMVELVIANNDEMALGAISALQAAGYNTGSGVTIPVFGVDATDAARSAISAGTMMGTIRQDAEGMASTIGTILDNFKNQKDKFSGIPDDNLFGTWRVNIPYSAYTGKE